LLITCPFWSPWLEVSNDLELITLLASLYPLTGDKSKDFWPLSSRATVKAIMDKLKSKNAKDIVNAFDLEYPEFYELMRGTSAQTYFSENENTQTLGLRSTIKNEISFFKYLPDEEGRKPWSAKDWVASPKGWVFLSSPRKISGVMKPLISLWIECLAIELLSRKITDKSRKVFLFIDEMQSLEKLSALEELLTRGRKRNVSIITGCQNISQIQEIYGDKRAITILSQPQTKILFRSSTYESAIWASNIIAEREVETIQESLSAGVQDIRDSINYSEQKKKELVVMPAEIQRLKKFTAFFVNTAVGTAKIKVERQPILNTSSIDEDLEKVEDPKPIENDVEKDKQNISDEVIFEEKKISKTGVKNKGLDLKRKKQLSKTKSIRY